VLRDSSRRKIKAAATESIARTVFAEVPVKAEYQLTNDDERLKPVIDVMRDFGLWLKGRPGFCISKIRPATYRRYCDKHVW
jgi:DNA-binding HxlR family transcriptional regulator